MEGIDAARKIVILAALAFGKLLSPERIPVQGIAGISQEQTSICAELGFAVKLIGHTEKQGEKILALVAPHAVPESNPICHVEGVNNGILVNANMVGKTFFYGPGAGKLPTASAIVADLLNLRDGGIRLPKWEKAGDADYADVKERVCRRIFRLAGCAKCAEKTKPYFGYETYLAGNGGFAFVSRPMTDAEAGKALADCGKELLWTIPVLD